ncbi:AAA family ATPase [Bacillus cereus]|uniref:AAA family ATPase n=2 Tax=Bacteria TaxID=2 RepID=UPI00362C059B
MNIPFNEALQHLENLLGSKVPSLLPRLNLSSDTYEGIFIKQLAASNTLNDPNKKGSQYHIALSNNAEINFFPYIDNYVKMINVDEGYSSEPFKRRYGFKVNIKLFKENLEYLTEQAAADINCFTTHYISRNGKQSELGSIATDSSEFTTFRRLFLADDVLIFLKHKQAFQYDTLLIRKSDYSNFEDIFHKTFVQYSGFRPTSSPSSLVDGEILTPDNFGTPGLNLIVYGAPGTGKSNHLKEKYGEDCLRVTFHPEYTYQDFVGCLKPKNEDDKVTYKFSPGPFAKILKEAYQSLGHGSKTLIIEEINRANTAAVFGDLFQLLDRNTEGISEYGIENDELLTYLNEDTDLELKNIKIPNNLNIVATMNSADQGVFLMDSAFKRRWKFKYIPIIFNEKDDICKTELSYAGKKFTWKQFIEPINLKLAKLKVNEDKHIGPYFMKKEEIEDEEIFASKLLMYLWDDVLRHGRDQMFRQDKYLIFSQLLAGFLNDEDVFKRDIFNLATEPTADANE